MAKVFIPFSLQELTGGLRELEVPGGNVREIVEQLDERYPGVREQLVEGNHLRLNITVAVDGEISPMGLLENVGEDSEVHFVAAIRGGSAKRQGIIGVTSTPAHATIASAPSGQLGILNPGTGMESRRFPVGAYRFGEGYGRRPTRSATRRTSSCIASSWVC